MTRSTGITHLTPPYSEDVAAVLARMMPKDSKVEPLKLFRTFTRNLPFATAIGPLGGHMLSRGRGSGAGYDERSRELVIHRVCALCDCEYEWGVHIASYASKVGLTEEQIYATVHGHPGDTCWDARDRSVLTMVDQLHCSGSLDDDAFQSLAAHFAPAVIIELLALAGWYHVISYVANGCRTELEDWAPRFPERRA